MYLPPYRGVSRSEQGADKGLEISQNLDPITDRITLRLRPGHGALFGQHAQVLGSILQMQQGYQGGCWGPWEDDSDMVEMILHWDTPASSITFTSRHASVAWSNALLDSLDSVPRMNRVKFRDFSRIMTALGCSSVQFTDFSIDGLSLSEEWSLGLSSGLSKFLMRELGSDDEGGFACVAIAETSEEVFEGDFVDEDEIKTKLGERQRHFLVVLGSEGVYGQVNGGKWREFMEDQWKEKGKDVETHSVRLGKF